jgi:hypothetical protein
MQYASRRLLSAEKLRAAAEIPVLGHALQAGAVRVNHVDIRNLQMLPTAVAHRHRAAAIGGERDPFAVGRPGRTEIAAGP